MKRALVVLALAACAPPAPPPVPTSVTPNAFGTTAAGYAVIRADELRPRLDWDARGAGAIDPSFTVRIGEVESDRVHLAGPGVLVARIPAGLPLGTHDIVVSGAHGGQGTLEGALCVGEPVPPTLIYVCVTDEGGGSFAVRLCEAPLDSDGTSPDHIVELIYPTPVFAFTLSPDRRTVAYLRPDFAGNLELVVARPWDTNDAWVVTHVKVPTNERVSAFSDVTFSRDGLALAWVEEGRRVRTIELDADGQPVGEPMTRFEETAVSGDGVGYLDFDPSGRWLLASGLAGGADNEEVFRGRHQDGFITEERHTLGRIDLQGTDHRALLPDSPYREGPGAFLPSGDGVLFVSNRLGLSIPTPFGVMFSTTNLYVYDPVDLSVSAVSNPTPLVLAGQPVISPDGRWAAAPGYLLDLSGSGIDIILTRLDTGEVYRAVADPDYACDEVQPDPASCPTLDIMPTFTPDSRYLVANAMAMQWSTQEVLDLALYRVRLPEGSVTLDASDRTLPVERMERLAPGFGFAVEPQVRQTFTGCD